MNYKVIYDVGDETGWFLLDPILLIALAWVVAYFLFTFAGIDPFVSLPLTMAALFGLGYVLQRVVINLVIGFAVPNISNAAHMGGAAAGALLALLIPYRSPRYPRRDAITALVHGYAERLDRGALSRAGLVLPKPS